MKFWDSVWKTKMCPAMQYCDVIANTNLACALPYRRAIDQLSRMIFVCIRIHSGSGDMQSSRFLFSSGIQCNADVVALSLPQVSKTDVCCRSLWQLVGGCCCCRC